MAAALAVAASLAAGAPARAASICGDGSRFFDGAKTPNGGTEYYGAVATIEYQIPSLCTSASFPAASTAWTMLASADSNGYAQVGYGNWRNISGQYGMKMFSQYSSCLSCSNIVTKYGADPGGTHEYITSYEPGGRTIWMLVNGVVLLDTTNFDPYGGAWARPVHAEIFAETVDCATDVIGTVSNAAGFSSIAGQTSPAGARVNMNDLALQSPNCGRHANKWGSFPTLFYTWTK